MRTLKKIAFHRNGISGIPFSVALFTDKEPGGKKQNMVGITFATKEFGYTAVLDTDLLAKGVIEFTKNSWRGDHFEETLKKWSK